VAPNQIKMGCAVNWYSLDLHSSGDDAGWHRAVAIRTIAKVLKRFMNIFISQFIILYFKCRQYACKMTNYLNLLKLFEILVFEEFLNIFSNN
jgi:hypothetical protein